MLRRCSGTNRETSLPHLEHRYFYVHTPQILCVFGSLPDIVVQTSLLLANWMGKYLSSARAGLLLIRDGHQRHRPRGG